MKTLSLSLLASTGIQDASVISTETYVHDSSTEWSMIMD